jgi:hypothetical protein
MNIKCQIMVQEKYRKAVVSLTHDSSMTEHLGVGKTSNGILAHFYLPNIRLDVAEHCLSCNVCGVIVKPIQSIRVAPRRSVPSLEESFSRVIVDCVEPLPEVK